MRVASMARLSDYDCIGFDLDHTLIQYKLGNFYPFIYKTFAQALVKEKGYDPCLLEDSFEDLKDFCLRGLILDTKKGNILKLHKNGFILRATHGTTQMTKEEVTECYGEKHIWPEISSLRENPSQHSTTFRLFESYFDLPVLTICARIIDMIDKKSGKPDEYNFWPDIISLLRQIFNPFAFRDQNGYFFPIMAKDTAKYVKPCSQNIIDWIKALKAGGQKVFLLTNSYIDYTSLLMNYAVGEHWPELFDIILCMAGKPGFFESQEPLTNFHEVDGEKEVGTVQELKENKMYSRGNHKDFTTFLKQQTSKDNPKVLYFGDSMRSDLYPSKVYGNWDVVTVLEEMESEGIVEQHSVNHDEPHDSVEDGPRSKKPRCQMHDHIEIEKNKEEVLLSNQWGSFFTHDDAALNGVIKDCGQCINNIMDGFFVCKTTKERRQMNTFGGDVIQKYSTIAIPRIDFITELRLDHPFETFTSSSGGFYPGFPKSLHL